LSSSAISALADSATAQFGERTGVIFDGFGVLEAVVEFSIQAFIASARHCRMAPAAECFPRA
jgi:hypothetical protein